MTYVYLYYKDSEYKRLILRWSRLFDQKVGVANRMTYGMSYEIE